MKLVRVYSNKNSLKKKLRKYLIKISKANDLTKLNKQENKLKLERKIEKSIFKKLNYLKNSKKMVKLLKIIYSALNKFLK